MADQFDRASELEERHRQAAISAALVNARRLKPTGFCHNCGNVVDAAKLFCDADCSEDFEIRERAKARK